MRQSPRSLVAVGSYFLKCRESLSSHNQKGWPWAENHLNHSESWSWLVANWTGTSVFKGWGLEKTTNLLPVLVNILTAPARATLNHLLYSLQGNYYWYITLRYNSKPFLSSHTVVCKSRFTARLGSLLISAMSYFNRSYVCGPLLQEGVTNTREEDERAQEDYS